MRYLDEEPKEKQSIWVTIADWWDCDYDSPIKHFKRVVIGSGAVLVIGIFVAVVQVYPMVLGVIVLCGMAYMLGILLEDWL